ncbi:SCO family protein [Robertkochia aurantiaca]|uniref:SCO family protein n=1 Tax=Robertkochia aurantiaca TaxID=2873700 RepID=UPI001CCEA022|nr:SCO family protein [Robertkochia sp. 3YJGBD-33]
MKNKSYIWIGLVILIFGIIFIPKIVDRLGKGEVVDDDRHQVGLKDISADDLVTLGSAPDFKFVNQSGDTITNEDYKDKVYVAEFFFTSCPTICPVMNNNMVKVQRAFKGEEDFGIVSFTIDPINDTPEVLRDYADRYGIELSNWNMLTGDLEDIMAVSNTGFNLYAGVNANADGGFEHSGMFALIDKNGKIRSRKDEFGNPIVYYDGTDPDSVAKLKKDIKALLNE